MSTPEALSVGGAVTSSQMPLPGQALGRPSQLSTPEGLSHDAKSATPSTPAELEAQSIALAYKLQQEEHAAFLQAVRVNSPSPRSAATAPVAVEHAMPAGAVHQHMTELEEGADADDESLQLALRLQQEELQWQSLQSRRTVAEAIGGDVDESLDEDVRLARLLQAQEDEGM